MKRKSTTEAAVVTTMYPPLMITNPIFGDNKPIPRQYTRDGANINPQLDIAGTPSTAKSLAVIMEDPDGGLHNWVHWVAWNIPVIRTLREARVMEAQGRNDFMEDFYDGPCPPYGTHRYFFKVYALDTLLDLAPHTTARELEKAMQDHILAYGEVSGTYRRY